MLQVIIEFKDNKPDLKIKVDTLRDFNALRGSAFFWSIKDILKVIKKEQERRGISVRDGEGNLSLFIKYESNEQPTIELTVSGERGWKRFLAIRYSIGQILDDLTPEAELADEVKKVQEGDEDG